VIVLLVLYVCFAGAPDADCYVALRDVVYGGQPACMERASAWIEEHALDDDQAVRIECTVGEGPNRA
jgi:hypothetical protein